MGQEHKQTSPKWPTERVLHFRSKRKKKRVLHWSHPLKFTPKGSHIRKNPGPTQVLRGALVSQSNYWRWNFKQNSNLLSPTSPPIWKSPKVGILKININDSFEEGSMKGAVACICKNSKGVLIDSSIVHAEYLALSEILIFLRNNWPYLKP